MKKIEIQEIDFGKTYTGYLWYSDQNSPIIFNSEILSESSFTPLPFIVEGYLYSSADGGVCLNIKNMDGRYYIHQVQLKELDSSRLERNVFEAIEVLKNKGIEKFKAVQFWGLEPDEYCQGMDVLQPEWIAFEGFEFKNN
ncbi:TIGR04423 family type III CRISPR-associated protein [Algoriphagus sp.]|uniref:TIGR04423 family type III CRISPR-associated protein n=1 Tax=Algoriphagus sp. TaxID=1872435 RepID=UPI00391A7261